MDHDRVSGWQWVGRIAAGVFLGSVLFALASAVVVFAWQRQADERHASTAVADVDAAVNEAQLDAMAANIAGQP